MYALLLSFSLAEILAWYTISSRLHSFFILGVLDHILDNNAHAFIAEIGMTYEGSL